MSEARFPYLEISPWVETPEDLQSPLSESLRCDVVVIGGGYTGLSTALALREQGASVAVLEQEFAGSGASGRNAGHLTPTIGKDIPTLLRLFGRERASRLVRFADDAVRFTEETIRKHGIDCDYAASGNIMAGVHPKHGPRLERAADTARELGAHVRYLPESEMNERGLPDVFCCGVLEECGGTFHPGRYVMGLRRAALAAGVRLYERSPLRELVHGAPLTAYSGDGEIVADHAVLATNAYTPSTGLKKRLVTPLRVSLFETAPLDPVQREALGWAGREGIYTSHETLESYHFTKAGTIVGGSKTIRYAWGRGLADGYQPAMFRTIEDAMRERFPQLGALPIRHFWGGWIGLNLDFLPALGTTGSHRNIHYGLGYAGHGVAQATLMGPLLAEQIAGRAHPAAEALLRREPPGLPEPLMWLGVKLLTGVFDLMDHRTDRQVRNARRA
ncbi:MAG: FAD-dependent oxidoreductase [bacterium]|nr:FAD-dependent oxidoreductase [bacterium]